MKVLSYPFLALLSILFTITAIVFAPVIALFVDSKGDLPQYLKWFQTPDAPCWGAAFWKQQNPTYSVYKLCYTWLQRNPAQGWEQACSVSISSVTPVKVYGSLTFNDQMGIGGWFLLIGGGVFQFSSVIPIGKFTIDTGLGWRLDPIVKEYTTPTLGALIVTPLRLHRI